VINKHPSIKDMFIRQKFTLALALLLVSPHVALADSTGKPKNMSGGELYHDYCSVCHGDRGDGNSRAKNSFIRPPRDFTAPEARTLPKEFLAAIVRDGKPGTAMVGWKTQLNDTQIDAVVDYIRTRFMGLNTSAEPRLAGAAKPTDKLADLSAPMPGNLKGSIDQGRNIYYANCATCHGTKGDGQGPRAYFINPKPRNFLLPTSQTAFSRPVIYEAVSNGRLGTEMPAWNKVLTEQEIAHVSEFVFQSFIQPGARK
jgi:mono/diheme cytochrome c family protein